MEKILALVGGAKVVFIIPLSRYVLSACCKDNTHVSNRLSGELAAEFSGAEKSLSEAAATGERTGTARLINILSFFGTCESLPQDLTTVDGASIWAVASTSPRTPARSPPERSWLTYITAAKRESRLPSELGCMESVVPIPAPAKKKEAAKSNPTPPPPRPCPPPLWLSGHSRPVAADTDTTRTRGWQLKPLFLL